MAAISRNLEHLGPAKLRGLDAGQRSLIKIIEIGLSFKKCEVQFYGKESGVSVLRRSFRTLVSIFAKILIKYGKHTFLPKNKSISQIS